MEIYIIIAISFGLMFAYRYVKNIIFTVREVAKIHEVPERGRLLYIISFWMIVFSVIACPFYALVVLITDRQTLIKDWSRSILIKHYEVEIKNSS